MVVIDLIKKFHQVVFTSEVHKFFKVLPTNINFVIYRSTLNLCTLRLCTWIFALYLYDYEEIIQIRYDLV